MERNAILTMAGVALLIGNVAAGANFWISQSGSAAAGPAPPGTVAEIASLTHSVGQQTGSLFIWGRPDTNRTLRSWSLNLTLSNPNVVALTAAHVQPYNPVVSNTGPPLNESIARWESVGEPGGNSPPGGPDPQNHLQGISIINGAGIGPTTASVDPFYNSANDAWLLARVDYDVLGILGQTDVYLQIGDRGIAHVDASNQFVPSSSSSVVFGAVTDLPLNGSTDRLTNSNTPDASIQVVIAPTINADFDQDGDVDGRDFLVRQAGHGISGGATLSSGDANGDGIVDQADHIAWEQRYGLPVAMPVARAAPEPNSLCLASILAPFCTCRRRRERRRIPIWPVNGLNGKMSPRAVEPSAGALRRR